VLALDLDNAVFYRTSGAAEFLQARGKLFELGRGQWQSADHRHALAAAPGDLPTHAHARRAGDIAGGRIKSGRCGRVRSVPQHDAAECVFGLHA